MAAARTGDRTKKAVTSPTPSSVFKGGLNINQELFCRYYTQHNRDLFGNATLSYAEAYGYGLDQLPDDDAKYQGTGEKREMIEPSTRQKAYNVCGVEGHRLLKNPKVLERITKLLNELLTDEVVDGELLKVILQSHDLGPKVRAISEYNKLRQRITDKLDLTSGGKTIADLITLAHGNPKSGAKSPAKVQG